MRRTILVLLLVIILLLFFLRSDSGIRLHMDQWVSIFTEISGIEIGDTVHYKGYIIGKVSDISPIDGHYKVVMDTLTATVLPERVAFEIVPGEHPYIDMKPLAVIPDENTVDSQEDYANKLNLLLQQLNSIDLEQKLRQIVPLADTIASLEGTNKGIKEFRQSLKDIEANKDELKKLREHLENLRQNLEETRSKLSQP